MPLLEQDGDPQSPGAVERITFAIVLAAVWLFLPELLLVNTEVWAVVALAIWAVSGLLHLSSTGMAIVAGIFGLAGLWLTYQSVRQAVANRDFG